MKDRCVVRAEGQATATHHRMLPMEIRVGLDIVFQRVCSGGGEMRSRFIGDTNLIEAISQYGNVFDDASHVTALGADAAEIRQTLTELSPSTVVTLSAMKNGDRIRRLRRDPLIIPTNLDSPEWDGFGLHRTGLVGIQGLGSLMFAAGHLLFTRANRPDVADRCRIGMLRTLVTTRPGVRLATIAVSEYRRLA